MSEVFVEIVLNIILDVVLEVVLVLVLDVLLENVVIDAVLDVILDVCMPYYNYFIAVPSPFLIVFINHDSVKLLHFIVFGRMNKVE